MLELEQLGGKKRCAPLLIIELSVRGEFPRDGTIGGLYLIFIPLINNKTTFFTSHIVDKDLCCWHYFRFDDGGNHFITVSNDRFHL